MKSGKHRKGLNTKRVHATGNAKHVFHHSWPLEIYPLIVLGLMLNHKIYGLYGNASVLICFTSFTLDIRELGQKLTSNKKTQSACFPRTVMLLWVCRMFPYHVPSPLVKQRSHYTSVASCHEELRQLLLWVKGSNIIGFLRTTKDLIMN